MTTGRAWKSDACALAFFPVVVLSLVVGTGNLLTGPRMADDNQIYRLQIEFAESGFLPVLADELRSRWEMNRLVPTYCVQKVVQARILGTNLPAWTIWTGLVGAGAGMLLYAFMRSCQYSVVESLAFALISILGEQSILWWRMLHGEGIGMVFLAAALVAMALRVNTGNMRYELAFCALITLAVLSKESFVLTIPALLLLKVWLTCDAEQLGIVARLRASLVSILWLMLVMVAVGATVLYVFGTTEFDYAGWEGFDGERFMVMWGQFLWLSNSWLVVSLIVFVLVAVYSSHAATTPADTGAANAKPLRRVASSTQQATRMALLWSFLLAWTFCLAVTGPQLLLYMKTGMLNDGETEADFARYILPGMIGFAFVVAHMLRLIRWQAAGRLWHLVWLSVALVGVSLFIESAVAYREGRDFAADSRTNDAWFESIEANTNVDEPIVLVYLNSADGAFATQAALRVYYILSQRHGRDNIYFCPIPPEPTLEQGV